MLKKSLIPAALVALSSVSAFADSESSFYLGVKGLYFMPKDEISKDFQSKAKSVFGPNAKLKQSGGIFLPGLQFGYNVSDSIRIGLAGYFGASKFKYTLDDFTVAPVAPAVAAAAGSDAGSDAGAPAAPAAPATRTVYGTSLQTAAGFTCKDMKIELGPRFVALATMDMKVYETDSFSLGFGIGAGAAKWKASFIGDAVVNGQGNVSMNTELGSKWKPAFMGTVNANVNLGDVAVLTGSVGYAHLGSPKGLKKDDKGATFDADENKAKGWVFGIGVGKEF